MTSNDKAKQQLMESMRITKAGSSMKIEEVDITQNIAPHDEKPVSATNRTAVTKKVAAKKKIAVTRKAAATKKTSSNSQKLAVDPFQAVRRVWPD